MNEQLDAVSTGRPADHEELLGEAARRSVVLGQLFRQAKQRLRADVGHERAEYGEAQYHVLHVLSECEYLNVGELAEQVHVADPTVSKMLNHLESDGLVERRLEPGNRRAVQVRITEAGRDVAGQLACKLQGAIAEVLRPLTNEQLNDFIRALDHVERLISRHSAE